MRCGSLQHYRMHAIDASIEGTCITNGVRTDDMTEEPQMLEHHCLGDRRLNRAETDFLVSDKSSEWDT